MSESPLDQSVLDELTDTMGQDFAAELVDTFLSEAPAMLDELAQAGTAQEEEAFRRAAHSIKSNAQTFGAMTLAEQARGLELDGIPDEMTASITALRSAFDAAADALRGAFDV